MDLKGKIIVLLISFLTQFSLSGQQIIDADYYFDGNDSNDDLTPATSRKTLNKFIVLGTTISNTTIMYNIIFDTSWASERQEPGYVGTSSGFFFVYFFVGQVQI